MTREELKAHCEKQIEMCEMWAISKGEKPSGKIYEEHKLILELLDQQPYEDAISRQAVIDALCDECELYKNGEQTCLTKCEEYHFLATLPSVIRKFECDDAISRQAVLDLVNSDWKYEGLETDVASLPPVTPQQKYGKWIDYRDEGFVECPFCGHATNCEDNIDELHYCFYCGARMVEPQESEE